MLYRTLTLFALTLLLLVGRAGADPASAFFAARQSVPGALLTGAAGVDAARHPGSYAGRTLELAATISGLVTVGADRTALLTLGSDSVSVLLPPGLRAASWLDAGVRVRALLVAAPDDGELPSGLRLVAVAPEGDVVAAEKVEAAHQAALARTLPFVTDAARPTRRPRVEASDYRGRPAGTLSPRALAIYAPYRGLVRRWNRRLSEADVDKITSSILYFSDINNIDPRLVVATIIAESDFDIRSTSRAGAMGLAQIMPDEARGLGVTNAYDPIQNIGAAVHLLRGHLDKYGGAPANAGVIPFDQIALTMAAYNAGPGAVRKYHGVPPYRETRRYIARITALYRQMCGSQQVSSR
jgi:soluble lytic murein transglycosylase-like protein